VERAPLLVAEKYVFHMSRKIVIMALAFVAMAPRIRAQAPSTNDLWDVNLGAVITAHSALDPADGSPHPYDAANIFGARIGTYLEGATGRCIFADLEPAGFVHFVEWQTASPVALRSFRLYATGDLSPVTGREFKTFRLFAKEPGQSLKLLHEASPNLPFSFVDPKYYLLINANVQPTTAQEWRAEWVVDGSVPALFNGPRIIELDGFGEISDFSTGLSAGLAGYYPFNADAKDYSGNGYDGITHNLSATTNRFSMPLAALSFNGASSYVSIPSSADLILEANFSLSLWIFQRAARVDGYRLIDKAYAGTTNGFVLDTYGNGGSGHRLRFQTGVVPGIPNNVVGATEYSLNQWHHVVATISGATGRLYLDGKLDGTGNVGKIALNNLEVFIGRAHPFNGGGNGEWFKGVIDDVRFYRRYLSAAEVLDIYNIEKAKPTVGPIFSDAKLVSDHLIQVLTGLLPGQRVILQSSTNLSTWLSVETNVPSTATLVLTNDFIRQVEVFRAFAD
jgi:hypothetical protein